MFSLLIVLLSFSESLAIKCLFLNDGPSMVRHIVIDSNPNELKYYPFMISIDMYRKLMSYSQKYLITKNMYSKRNKKHIY